MAAQNIKISTAYTSSAKHMTCENVEVFVIKGFKKCMRLVLYLRVSYLVGNEWL